ncbi:MAG: metallophosphoesterase [Oscillospiraceae bacterium]|nr:metallophosphoesterase [Oscillospiraceae bacterium]
MKILVLSDCHGDVENVEAAIRQTSPDKVMFLGDGVNDFAAAMEKFPSTDWYAVTGNCDRRSPFNDELTVNADGHKIFAVHGDKYNVKFSLLSLLYRAREKDAQIALFGHTHWPVCKKEDDIWLINPGSCRRGFGGTCAVLEVNTGGVECRIIKII